MTDIPTPPGDLPLIEGLDSGWNEFVSAIPEDRRAELGPKLKERVSSYESLKQWEDLQKSGITPDFADTALRVYSALENNPRDVYEAIGKSLGISTQQAKEVVEEIQDADPNEDPRIARMQQQLDTMSQIMLGQRDMSMREKQQAEADAALEKELDSVKSKYGSDPNFNEEEIVMRMLHMNMSAEEAYQNYAGRVTEIQKRRAAPFVMGSGGHVPSSSIDVTKLNNKDTKNLVAQMLTHANNENNR